MSLPCFFEWASINPEFKDLFPQLEIEALLLLLYLSCQQSAYEWNICNSIWREKEKAKEKETERGRERDQARLFHHRDEMNKYLISAM